MKLFTELVSDKVSDAFEKAGYDREFGAVSISKRPDLLVNTVEEFWGMNPKDVVKYIEGEPYISTVPLDPGMTNTKERKEESN